jgi:hypothetical protein
MKKCCANCSRSFYEYNSGRLCGLNYAPFRDGYDMHPSGVTSNHCCDSWLQSPKCARAEEETTSEWDDYYER